MSIRLEAINAIWMKVVELEGRITDLGLLQPEVAIIIKNLKTELHWAYQNIGSREDIMKTANAWHI